MTTYRANLYWTVELVCPVHHHHCPPKAFEDRHEDIAYPLPRCSSGSVQRNTVPEKKSPVAEPKTRRILATPPIATSIMASKRTPLAPISHNQATRKELTPFERGQILGYATAGYSHSKIGALLGRSKSTI